EAMPSGKCGAVAPGPPWSVSGFRLRARLGLSTLAYVNAYLPLFPASEELPPLLDTALLIRAPEGLEPSRSTRCSARTMPSADFCRPVRSSLDSLSRVVTTGRQISWGNTSRLRRAIAGSTLPVLDGYGLGRARPAGPTLAPHIRFLFIDSRFCYMLPSD